MARANLTDKAVRAAKAPPEQRIEIWDEGCAGLCLRVSDSGKAFFFRYRAPNGKQPRVKLGNFSEVFGLAEARMKAMRLRIQVQDGADPAAETRSARSRALAAALADTVPTFNALADKFLEASEKGEWKPKKKQKRATTIAAERGVLKRHIRKTLGSMAPAEIVRADVRRLLNGMRDAKIVAQTVKAHATIRQVFAYAIAEELGGVIVNPAVGFPSPVSMTPRARVLSDGELKGLWSALVDPAGLKHSTGEKATVGRPARIALQLAMLLLQRRGEIAGMRVAELDLDHGLWLIPPDRMKAGRSHLVALPPRAVALIREAMALAKFDWDEQPPTVFPARGNAQAAIRPDSLTHAMAEICAALEIEGATIHDLRRTGSTALTSERLGISPFIRSQVLGHMSDSGGGAAVSSAHYDANTYISEKRRALEAWEGLLLEIVGERPSRSGILAFRKSAT